jgi:threonine/homoserine/homoserine lactone efflux protein
LTVDDQRDAKPARKVIASAVLSNLLSPKLTLFFLPSCRSSSLSVRRAARRDARCQRRVPGDEARRVRRLSPAAAAVRDHLISRRRGGRRVRRIFAVSFVALGAKPAATTR